MKDRLIRIESFTRFGDFLRYLRIRAQLTQKDLAIAVGYSEAQISRLESSKRAPDPDVLQALFVPALGLEDQPETVSWLLTLAKNAREVGTFTQAINTKKQDNLPAELTSLVGRKADLAEIDRLLALRATRLLTLTGAGGSGKSRLALRAGRNLAGNFPNGVHWADLATLSDPRTVPQALVTLLGLATSPNYSPVVILTAYLRERALLLILDNCEHLVEAVARLAVDLISSCPHLKILATSREPLGAPCEILYRVPSLAMPPTDGSSSVESYAAAQLFLQRAASIQPGFHLTEGEGPALARICRRLDGIPLAIELAAGRANVLSLSQLADRLEEGFHVLGTNERSHIPRHATLRAVVDWSYNLLPEPEQALLRRLPFFAGSWTLEQAEEICAGEKAEQEQMLERLAGLVSKSLVMTERLPEGVTEKPVFRYRLHEMVRQYALQKLAEAGEEEGLLQRFLNCFITIAEKAETGLKSPRQFECLASLDQEYANLVQALTLAAAHRKALELLRLSGALDYYWQLRDLPLEAVRWLEPAIAMPEPAQAGEDWLRARAKALLCIIRYRGLRQPNTPDIHKIVNECEHIYQSLDDQEGLFNLTLQTLGMDGLEIQSAVFDRLHAHLPELIAAGDHWTAARVLFVIGSIERTRGNILIGDRARKKALVHAQIAGDISFQSLIMQWLAWAEWDQGNVRQGLKLHQEAAEISIKVGKPFLTANAFRFQACFYFVLGDYRRGDAAMSEAMAIFLARGAYWMYWDAMEDVCLFNIFQGRLAEAREAIEDKNVVQYVEENPTSYGAGMYYEYLGIIHFFEGDVDGAVEIMAKAFEIPNRMNEHVDLHQLLRAMGLARLAQGNLPAAREMLYQTLAEITRNHALPDFPETLDALAQLAIAEGQPVLAAQLLGASDGLLKRMEMVRYPVFRPAYDRCREVACTAVEQAVFAAAYSEGEAVAEGPNPIEAVMSLMDR